MQDITTRRSIENTAPMNYDKKSDKTSFAFG